jgi:cell division protein FtsN
MLRKKIWKISIPVFILGTFLLTGCTSLSAPEYYGRTMFMPLKSSPEGARVLLDGKQKGYTPMTMQFFYLHDSRGSHSDETRQRTLKIEKEGYEPYIFPFSIAGKEYEQLPDSIALKRFEEEVQTVDAPEKVQPTMQEDTEEKEQDKEAVKEIGEPEVSLPLLKEKDVGVKQADLPGKDKPKTQEKEAPKESQELEKEISLLREKNEREEIKKPDETIIPQEYADKTTYTIQTGSFNTSEHAQNQFLSIIQSLEERELDYLRIEEIGKLYTVRLGTFEDYAAADKTLQAIKPKFSETIIVKAYIKENRILKLYKKEEKMTYKEAIAAIEDLEGKNNMKALKKPVETITPSEFPYQTMYTIQTGSFNTIEQAQNQFLSIIQSLEERELDYLRIEEMGKLYTVRLGRFKDYTTAGKILKAIKPLYSEAVIVKGFTKDAKIKKLYKKSSPSAPATINNY